MDADQLASAWSSGIAHVEHLLAPDVQLMGWSGDGTPCVGRDEVMALVRALAEPTSDQLPELIFEDISDGVVLVCHPSTDDDPYAVGLAIAVYGRGDQVVTLVQYDSRAHALQHLSSPEDADTTMPMEHPQADAAIRAIHTGDIGTLTQLLGAYPELATARLGTRTLLHVATDWPGHFPSAAQAIALLVSAGADVNARFAGRHQETPLHWAASSNDVDALDALLDAGADIEAAGAVIGGGTALADATAFGQWEAARRLIQRGARATLGEAASLGLLARIQDHLSHGERTPHEVTRAFWMACHGAQLAAAQLLHQRGADINWIGWDDLTPHGAATRSQAQEVIAWLEHIGALANTREDQAATRPGQAWAG